MQDVCVYTIKMSACAYYKLGKKLLDVLDISTKLTGPIIYSDEKGLIHAHHKMYYVKACYNNATK